MCGELVLTVSYNRQLRVKLAIIFGIAVIPSRTNPAKAVSLQFLPFLPTIDLSLILNILSYEKKATYQ